MNKHTLSRLPPDELLTKNGVTYRRYFNGIYMAERRLPETRFLAHFWRQGAYWKLKDSPKRWKLRRLQKHIEENFRRREAAFRLGAP